MSSVPTASSTSKSRTKPKPSRVTSHQAPSSSSTASSGNRIASVEFEIRGKVQGVHFRKYTKMKAESLNLRGWCKNTAIGSVVGCVQGDMVKINLMKDWLRRIGSPKSKIFGAEFKKSMFINNYDFHEFQIVKEDK